ncbi:MAG: 6-phosphogluconolactonase [Oligoflexus sp.]
MKTVFFKQPDQWIDASWQWLKETIEVYGIKTFFLPAGASPQGLYAKMEAIKPDFLNDIKFIQVDDILSGGSRGRFRRNFEEQLPSYTKQIHFIDQGERQAEAAILGLGLNGHVAFHEPHLPENFQFGEITLSSETCQNLQVSPGTKGLSYGLGHFLGCRRILVLVNGSHKRPILQRTLAGDPDIPASRFLQHADTTVLALETTEGI